MAIEARLQAEITKHLKSKGCFVAKMPAHPGVPTGTPDLFFCKEGFYGFIEVKASKTARFQPLQKERIAIFDKWSWAKAVYPTNWPEVKKELDIILP